MKVPSAGTPVSPDDLARSLLGESQTSDFKAALERTLGVTWCGLAGSGTASLYAILNALKKSSDRTEVLLPAYTAPSLILPIRKAGLRPVLTDISPETFNSGSEEMLSRVGSETLALMPVHMFGLPTDVDVMASQVQGSGVYLVEDACSSMGAEIGGRPAGTWGDVGFYSFNRGKNLSTVRGGAVVTSREDLIPGLEAALDRFPEPGLQKQLSTAMLSYALAIVVRPMGYTFLHPIIGRFKYTALHTDFETVKYTSYQARLGLSLLGKFSEMVQERIQNGRLVFEALSDVDGVRLPASPRGVRPVLNQFPILLPDERTRDAVHSSILALGLEATLLYPEPIHRIYPDLWDTTGSDPYPHATAVARRLLLLPVHPLVPRKVLQSALDTLRKTLK